MKKKNSHFLFLDERNPWTNNPNAIWLGSVMSLQRNIEKFNFPSKLEEARRKQIVSLVSKTVDEKKLVQGPHLFRAEEMDPLEKEFLVEHFLSSQSFHHAHGGEAFIIDDKGEILIAINVRDHVQIQRIDTEGHLEDTWNSLVKLETDLGQSIHYAFSPKFGFLTADPAQCGTAFYCQVFLQLAGLSSTGELEQALELVDEDSISINGLQGKPNDFIGDLIVITNNYTLGLTEENILSNIHAATTKLLVQEKRARKEIAGNHNAEIKDQVSRAYAILTHSYQVDAIEALNAISLLKLGVDLEWVTGIAHQTLNDLFFRCRRAHLLNHLTEIPDQEEIPHLRAEFIHEALKQVKLHV